MKPKQQLQRELFEQKKRMRDMHRFIAKQKQLIDVLLKLSQELERKLEKVNEEREAKEVLEPKPENNERT